MVNWIVWIRTVLLNWIAWNRCFWQLTRTYIKSNWLYKNGFALNNQQRLICHKTQINYMGQSYHHEQNFTILLLWEIGNNPFDAKSLCGFKLNTHPLTNTPEMKSEVLPSVMAKCRTFGQVIRYFQIDLADISFITAVRLNSSRWNLKDSHIFFLTFSRANLRK